LQSEAEEEAAGEIKAHKRIAISIFPMVLYVFFIAAAVFYAFVRVAYGMEGLNANLQAYSYFVLVVELLGMINMLFYGCWLFAKPNNKDVHARIDENVRRPRMRCHSCASLLLPRCELAERACVVPPGSGCDRPGTSRQLTHLRVQGMELPLRREYNVRVLVPCYKESLAIIQRTVLAARRADRPPGTSVTIYICDDGNDARKRAWVRRLNDPEVLYVVGRDKVRAPLPWPPRASEPV
jgi:hypothetical protein